MTKSGKIKSKSDKLTKFFLDFADDVDGSQHIQGIILHCSLYLILFPTFYVPYR